MKSTVILWCLITMSIGVSHGMEEQKKQSCFGEETEVWNFLKTKNWLKISTTDEKSIKKAQKIIDMFMRFYTADRTLWGKIKKNCQNENLSKHFNEGYYLFILSKNFFECTLCLFTQMKNNSQIVNELASTVYKVEKDNKWEFRESMINFWHEGTAYTWLEILCLKFSNLDLRKEEQGLKKNILKLLFSKEILPALPQEVQKNLFSNWLKFLGVAECITCNDSSLPYENFEYNKDISIPGIKALIDLEILKTLDSNVREVLKTQAESSLEILNKRKHQQTENYKLINQFIKTIEQLNKVN